MSEERPICVGTMCDGALMGVALLDTPKRSARPVDGDDYTWDWHQALGDAGHFSVDEDGIAVNVTQIQYDTRTGHETLSAHIARLEARLARLEDVIRGWTGD